MARLTFPAVPYKTAYDLFGAWVEQCLEHDASLIFPGKRLWTAKNLNTVVHELLSKPDEGGGSYKEKLEKQFKDYPEGGNIWLLICDLLALHYGPVKDIDNTNVTSRIPALAGVQSEVNKKICQMDGALSIKGQDYKIKAWYSIGYYASLACKYKQDHELRQLIQNLRSGEPDWERAESMLHNENIIDDKYVHQKHEVHKGKRINQIPTHCARIVQHMLCPQYHSSIVTKDKRGALVKAHTGMRPRSGYEPTNEQIYSISNGQSFSNSEAPGKRIKLPAPNESTLQALNTRAPNTYPSSRTTYSTSNALSDAAKHKAGYKCQYNSAHKTFKNPGGIGYVEVHHLIPLSKYRKFPDDQLDCMANIVVLCPNCHRAVHHGNNEEKHKRLEKLHELKKAELKKAGFEGLTPEKLKELYNQ